MSASPSLPNPPPTSAHEAEARAIAQLLRALEAQPGCAALCSPPDRAGALVATLAERSDPQLRAIVVHGGGHGPDAFCEQLLRALHAGGFDRPRAVFEAYLAHLRSLGSHLLVLVEGADALHPATLECVTRWVRRPASALRLVAAGTDPTALLRVVDFLGARGSFVHLGGERRESQAQELRARGEPRQAAVQLEAGSAAPAPIAYRRRIAWPLGAAGLTTLLASGLLWSRVGDLTQPSATIEETTPSRAAAAVEPDPVGGHGGRDASALDVDDAALASADASRWEVGGEEKFRLDAPPETSDPAPAEAPPLEAVLDALDAGDSDAYKRALRRIDGPAAVQAEAQLVRRLEAPPRSDPMRERSERMLAAWGLALVGTRDALPSLDVAADDADPHVAALAARSAGVIRARLAADASDSGPP
jgi:hypothetical protein